MSVNNPEEDPEKLQTPADMYSKLLSAELLTASLEENMEVELQITYGGKAKLLDCGPQEDIWAKHDTHTDDCSPDFHGSARLSRLGLEVTENPENVSIKGVVKNIEDDLDPKGLQVQKFSVRESKSTGGFMPGSLLEFWRFPSEPDIHFLAIDGVKPQGIDERLDLSMDLAPEDWYKG